MSMAPPRSPVRPSVLAWHDTLGRKLAHDFPERHATPGTVGRESEFPLVRSDGTCGDLLQLWPYLSEAVPDFEPKREKTGLLVELAGSDTAFVAEVGRGTVEIVVGPHRTLHGTRDAHLRARDVLMAACARADQRLLGYGIQPATPPCAPIQTPKQRYSVLHDVLGDDWLWFAVTASDQTHLAVDRGDALAATRVAHLLTPVLVALCANSPIAQGHDMGVVTTREARMGMIHADHGRHGLPIAADTSWADLVARYSQQPWLVRERFGIYDAASGTFDDYLARLPSPDTVGQTVFDDVFRDFVMHEHYIWNSARPRNAHGTVEVRAACQQPLQDADTMVASALAVGILAGYRELDAWLTDRFGEDTWSTLRNWHHAVVHDGLRAPPPAPDLIEEALTRIQAALEARGHGEEVYLEQAWARLSARQSPADRARAAFETGGIAALVDHAAAH